MCTSRCRPGKAGWDNCKTAAPTVGVIAIVISVTISITDIATDINTIISSTTATGISINTENIADPLNQRLTACNACSNAFPHVVTGPLARLLIALPMCACAYRCRTADAMLKKFIMVVAKCRSICNGFFGHCRFLA